MKAALKLLHGTISCLIAWVIGFGYFEVRYQIEGVEVFRILGWGSKLPPSKERRDG